MAKKLISAFILSILISTNLFAQEDLLIKIPESSNRHLQSLQIQHGIKLRYRTPDFAIIQFPLHSDSIGASQDVLTELPDSQVLDTVTPGFNYYVLWLPSAAERAAIGTYGEILDQFGGSCLLKLHANLESVLLDLPVHQRAKLPDNIILPEFQLPHSLPAYLHRPSSNRSLRDYSIRRMVFDGFGRLSPLSRMKTSGCPVSSSEADTLSESVMPFNLMTIPNPITLVITPPTTLPNGFAATVWRSNLIRLNTGADPHLGS